MSKKYNILICPLEWGLGHAARMIPLARRLRELDNNIIVAAGEKHLSLFSAEMNGIKLINFPGFSPGYSRYFPQYLVMLLKTPLLLYHIMSEHFRLKTIIRDHEIDIVISDNRFGLWNSKVTTVYVTHLPRIPLPSPWKWLQVSGVLLHRFIINKYTFCFIPDVPGDPNASGKLSHGVKLPDNVRFTGIISRFSSAKTTEIRDTHFRHNTVILSGPEPQRSMLKKKLVAVLRKMEIPSVILEGRPDKGEQIVHDGKIIYYSHLSAKRMQEMIESSECVISRSGYTTVMDLLTINCSALLIPTPGQTEQEYLAGYLAAKGWFTTINQNDIKDGLKLPPKISPMVSFSGESKLLLEKALDELLNYNHKKH